MAIPGLCQTLSHARYGFFLGGMICNLPKSHKRSRVSLFICVSLRSFIVHGEKNYLTLFVSYFSLQYNTVPEFLSCLVAILQTLRACQRDVLDRKISTQVEETILVQKEVFNIPASLHLWPSPLSCPFREVS